MSKTFFTSDNHFFHKRITEYCNRPFKDALEMNEQMIINWNKKVSPDDIIYLMGDFCFGTKNKWIKILQQLNGTKHLITGNHDNPKHIPIEYFESIQQYKEIKISNQTFCLFHFPISSWHRMEWNNNNLHGHIHSHDKSFYRAELGEVFTRVEGDKQLGFRIDVGVDSWDYTPVEFNELMEWVGEQNV